MVGVVGEDFPAEHLEFFRSRLQAQKDDLLSNAGETVTLLPQDGTTAWCVSRDPVGEYVHPNQKPAALALKALHLSSQPGDVVVDMFAGSGSTLIACEQSGRKARCIEIHPHFAAAAIERWHLMTGMQPVRNAA